MAVWPQWTEGDRIIWPHRSGHGTHTSLPGTVHEVIAPGLVRVRFDNGAEVVVTPGELVAGDGG